MVHFKDNVNDYLVEDKNFVLEVEVNQLTYIQEVVHEVEVMDDYED